VVNALPLQPSSQLTPGSRGWRRKEAGDRRLTPVLLEPVTRTRSSRAEGVRQLCVKPGIPTEPGARGRAHLGGRSAGALRAAGIWTRRSSG